ncbi:cysteine--tRNA ligase [Candidatus Woesearchaeota archaeon]|nr:MAG: cysteine--tRNA ligase [Candidatus Woesearchaeota archaeon]
MSLRLYNTLSRKKEEFAPLKNNKVGMYSCGPTVYNYAHIGNLRTYIFNDILRKTLKYLRYDLTHVMNITDVGHLTSDADEGEDKMLKGAKREKKTVWQIAKYYTDAFMDDMKKLNIEIPDVIPKATDNIDKMQEITQTLIDKDYAYISEGNVYFDTSKFADYSNLGNLDIDQLKSGARVDEDSGKRNPSDFVLWFTKSKFDDQEMKWDSPWGKGYPGWHIECSAMSSKYLGNQFDIHTGGIDHIPVHHTNEIAQSECAFGKKPWVKYWVHGEFLVVDKDKMSKSSGDFLRLKTLIDKGFNPLHYRFFCLNAHYRQQLHFSFDALDAAKNGFENLKKKIIDLKDSKNNVETNIETKTNYETNFINSISDDLNMPKAMALVQNIIKDKELSNKDKLDLLYDFDKVLGLGFKNMKKEKIEVSNDIIELAKKRKVARDNKDWSTADKIRDELKEKGYVVKDTNDGKFEFEKI